FAAALHAAGATIINSFPVSLRLRDKVLTCKVLQAAGVPTPATYVASHVAQLVPLLAAGPLVVKPYRGSQGVGVRVFHDPAELTAFSPPPEPILAQRFHRPDGRDRKILVIGGEIFGAPRAASPSCLPSATTRPTSSSSTSCPPPRPPPPSWTGSAGCWTSGRAGRAHEAAFPAGASRAAGAEPGAAGGLPAARGGGFCDRQRDARGGRDAPRPAGGATRSLRPQVAHRAGAQPGGGAARAGRAPAQPVSELPHDAEQDHRERPALGGTCSRARHVGDGRSPAAARRRGRPAAHHQAVPRPSRRRRPPGARPRRARRPGAARRAGDRAGVRRGGRGRSQGV